MFVWIYVWLSLSNFAWMSVWTCAMLSDTYIDRQTVRQTDKAIFKIKIDIGPIQYCWLLRQSFKFLYPRCRDGALTWPISHYRRRFLYFHLFSIFGTIMRDKVNRFAMVRTQPVEYWIGLPGRIFALVIVSVVHPKTGETTTVSPKSANRWSIFGARGIRASSHREQVRLKARCYCTCFMVMKQGNETPWHTMKQSDEIPWNRNKTAWNSNETAWNMNETAMKQPWNSNETAMNSMKQRS